jgi:hypothetical protein
MKSLEVRGAMPRKAKNEDAKASSTDAKGKDPATAGTI